MSEWFWIEGTKVMRAPLAIDSRIKDVFPDCIATVTSCRIVFAISIELRVFPELAVAKSAILVIKLQMSSPRTPALDAAAARKEA